MTLDIFVVRYILYAQYGKPQQVLNSQVCSLTALLEFSYHCTDS
jgi:hypothetical protein